MRYNSHTNIPDQLKILYTSLRLNLYRKIHGGILPDLSKAPDAIGRSKLWWVLYEEDFPKPLIQMLIDGHIDAQLCSRHNGNFGPYVHNDACFFQGIPIRDQLFIIYADRVMSYYRDKSNYSNIHTPEIHIRNMDAELQWANYR